MQNNFTPVKFSNISATPTAFTLQAGMYGIEAVATWSSGSVTLNRLAADASTYVSTGIVFSANGFQTVQIPAGTYQLAIATATGVYVDIAPIVITP